MTRPAGASSDHGAAARPPRSGRTLVILTIGAAVMIVILLGLGTWQVRRLAWKRDLIARVDAGVHARPVPAPGPIAWPAVDAERAAYRRIVVTGRYLADRSVRTQAATVWGSGSWLLTPLRTDRGFVILVNRGFVPPGWRDPGMPDRPVTVTGLLRITEPQGGFLRKNDPAADRWYSRDVAAIAAARHLERAAPYFIDADVDPDTPTRPPIGGLTVIHFSNNHLGYAITWYVLAVMVVVGWVTLVRHERRGR